MVEGKISYSFTYPFKRNVFLTMSFISHFQLSLTNTLAQYAGTMLSSETRFPNYALQLLVIIVAGHSFIAILLKTDKARMKHFMYLPVTYKHDVKK